MSSTARMLSDGRRLFLQHGPIDLIVEAWGGDDAVEAAYEAVAARFSDLLPMLAIELPVLKIPLGKTRPAVDGPVAQRMVAACWPHRAVFITPMAAVAGSVADEMRDTLVAAGTLQRAYVNNGGDISFHLARGERLTAGMVADLGRPAVLGQITIDAAMAVRGLATSGWRGRSFSCGIADAVTVLGRSAAAADAAATMVANAVDVDHPAIVRAPANSVREDSDLGDLLVTTDVGALPRAAVRRALEHGRREAERLLGAGLIEGAVLALQGDIVAVSHPSPSWPGSTRPSLRGGVAACGRTRHDARVKPGHDGSSAA